MPCCHGSLRAQTSRAATAGNRGRGRGGGDSHSVCLSGRQAVRQSDGQVVTQSDGQAVGPSVAQVGQTGHQSARQVFSLAFCPSVCLSVSRLQGLQAREPCPLPYPTADEVLWEKGFVDCLQSRATLSGIWRSTRYHSQHASGVVEWRVSHAILLPCAPPGGRDPETQIPPPSCLICIGLRLLRRIAVRW